MTQRVLVTGGAGYVGSVLVPKLLAAGHRVRVLDLYWFGAHVLDAVKDHPGLEQVKGDLRDAATLRRCLGGCDAVIHLACISNDPSFEMNPELGRSINHTAFAPLVDAAIEAGVRRFIYASSSSVYGVKKEVEVTEDLPLEPLTDYSRYKALCEEILLAKRCPGFCVLIVRPATVCGDSPRLRLDLTVNVLTAHAFQHRMIKVFGGGQMRPNIHIEDMTDLYVQALAWPEAAIDGRIYNAGYHNHTVSEIAELVRGVVGDDVGVVGIPTDDLRSYHISSAKLQRELGFQARRGIGDAVLDLLHAFQARPEPDFLQNPLYSNIKRLQQLGLA